MSNKNHESPVGEESTGDVVRMLVLVSAVAVAILVAMFFAPTGRTAPNRPKGVNATPASVTERDASQLEAFSKAEPYRTDFSTPNK